MRSGWTAKHILRYASPLGLNGVSQHGWKTFNLFRSPETAQAAAERGLARLRAKNESVSDRH